MEQAPVWLSVSSSGRMHPSKAACLLVDASKLCRPRDYLSEDNSCAFYSSGVTLVALSI